MLEKLRAELTDALSVAPTLDSDVVVDSADKDGEEVADALGIPLHDQVRVIFIFFLSWLVFFA